MTNSVVVPGGGGHDFMISIRGGWRVAALLVAVLAGTVSGAGAVSKPLMTRLMQTSPTEGTPPVGTVVVLPNPQEVADELLRDVDLVPGGAAGFLTLFRLFPAAVLSTDSADWSARSSDTSVVTVGFNLRPRPALWIRPLGTGRATITVGYTGYGNSVSLSFTVTVADPAPATGDDPPDTFDPEARPDPQGTWDRSLLYDLQADGNPMTLRATSFIRANDQMAEYSRYWSAQSSDTSVVTVSLARGTEDAGERSRPALRVWVWPEGNGEATITLAYARHGKSATTRFTVRVGPGADGEPAAVANVQTVVNEEVVDQAGGLEPGGRSVAIDVNDLFVNVGGATGRDFSATSSDGRVVTVEVTDNPHVVIRPVGEGLSTVTVRYTAGGRSVRATFGVAVGEGFVPPVPALPLAAAGLLAALLFGAGLQRRRRSR